MPLHKVPLRQSELLDLLHDMAIRIEAGDSYEGSIEYLMGEPDDPPGTYRVSATYRIGHLMGWGQGGIRTVGTVTNGE